MNINEKASRLALALRDGVDVYHGVDFVADIVEVLEHVSTTEQDISDVKDELRNALIDINKSKRVIDARLDDINDELTELLESASDNDAALNAAAEILTHSCAIKEELGEIADPRDFDPVNHD